MSRAAPPVRWAPNQPIAADKLNRMIDEGLREITVGPGLSIIRTPGGRVAITLKERNYPVAAFSVSRVKATSTNATTGLINCKLVAKDTTTAVGDEFAVRLVVSHAVGETFFAVRSQNGTDFVGVDWIELFSTKPTQQYTVLTPIDTTLLPTWTDPRFGL